MGDITEFRATNPEYADMSDTGLADALYAKYYTGMPRDAFDLKFLGKRSTGLAGLGNAIADRWNSDASQFQNPSAMRMVKDLIYNPIKGGAELTKDAIQRGQNLDISDPGAIEKLTGAALVPSILGGVVRTGLPRQTGTLGIGGGRMMPVPERMTDSAAKIINSALDKDALAISAIADAGGAASRAGAGTVAPLDLGGKNLTDLAGVLHRSGGAAGETIDRALAARAEGQGDRLAQGVTRHLADPNIAYKTADDLFQASVAESGPAYKSAYAHQLDTAHPRYQDIEFLLTTDAGQKALVEAKSLLANEARRGAPPPPAIVKDPVTNKWGFATKPDTEALDTTMRAMQDVIEKNKTVADLGKPARMTSVGASVHGVHKDMRSALFELNPKFQQARQQFATKADLREAINAGLRSLNKPAEEIAADMAKMSPQIAEHYRIGVARALRGKIERPDGVDVDRTRGMLSPDFERKLSAIFPNDQLMRPGGQGFDHTRALLQYERLQATQKNKIARGSQTADRVGSDARALGEGVGEALGMAKEIAANPITGTLRHAFDWYVKHRYGLNDPKVAADVAKMLVQRVDDPAAFQALITRLEKQKRGL